MTASARPGMGAHLSISMRYLVLGGLGLRMMGQNWWPQWISVGR